MNKVEKKIKKCESYGYKLFKLYATGEERDPDLPDILAYIGGLYENLTTVGAKLASSVLRKDDAITRGDLHELNLSRKTAQEFLNTDPKDLADYYFVKIYHNYVDLSILPIQIKQLDIVTAETDNNTVKLVATGEQLSVYEVPVIGSLRSSYIPLESYSLNGNKIIINPDALVKGHPYAKVAEHVVERSHMCKDCGEIFDLLPTEEAFYNCKGLNLPKRCKACRKKKNI